MEVDLTQDELQDPAHCKNKVVLLGKYLVTTVA